MLVVTRKPQQSITLSGGIVVTVTAIDGRRARIGIEAPDDVKIIRTELLDTRPIKSLKRVV